MMRTVYLSGPITGLTYDAATDWRTSVAETLLRQGIRGISPMRHIPDLGITPYAADCGTVEKARRIVARDAYDVRSCDALLINLLQAQRVSIGTVWEIGYACALAKPVIVVDQNGSVHDHAFICQTAAAVCSTLDESVAQVVELLGAYASLPPAAPVTNIALAPGQELFKVGEMIRVTAGGG